MEFHGIDHIELNVGDAQHSAFYLCTALGFRLVGQGGPETGLTGQRSLLLRQGRIQLLLTSGLHADHPATEFVVRHGDGVATIALETTDTYAAFAEAVAAGANPVLEPAEYGSGTDRVVVAEVGGFGDVRHRFVQRAPESTEFLPGAIELLATDPDASEDLLQEIDHIAVCLPAGQLAPTVAYYERVFGFRTVFEEFIEVGEQAMDSKVVQSRSTEVTLTLLQPGLGGEPGQISRFLDSHGGAGVQHLAFLTEDIIGTVRTFQDRGVSFLRTGDRYYDAVSERLGDIGLDIGDLRDTSVLVDRDHWGEVFQIFTRSMHVRDTYFIEIIDRHGAKTFGSGNIKALYEAVQAVEKSLVNKNGAAV
ncbi:4-hydroxyphenylpyruvate dioxygenase [Nocardia sp. NPDC101769]|uniref:4-hydroxyphenylpyruvate dioxygenase n=1 Tax=Nocardia sp. NPDC101769 TaxID=3364333 RepID=UPI0038255728